MTILVDTNVVVDVFLKRAPFDADSVQVLAAVEAGEATGVLCSTTLTTVYYLVGKELGDEPTRRRIANLLKLFDVVPVTRAMFHRALALDFRDFEDAVLHEAAAEVGAETIVTRNAVHFRNARVEVLTPEAFVLKLRSLRA